MSDEERTGPPESGATPTWSASGPQGNNEQVKNNSSRGSQSAQHHSSGSPDNTVRVSDKDEQAREQRLVDEIKADIYRRIDESPHADKFPANPGAANSAVDFAFGFARQQIKRDLEHATQNALRHLLCYCEVNGGLLDLIVRYRDRLKAIDYLKERWSKWEGRW